MTSRGTDGMSQTRADGQPQRAPPLYHLCRHVRIPAGGEVLPRRARQDMEKESMFPRETAVVRRAPAGIRS